MSIGPVSGEFATSSQSQRSPLPLRRKEDLAVQLGSFASMDLLWKIFYGRILQPELSTIEFRDTHYKAGYQLSIHPPFPHVRERWCRCRLHHHGGCRCNCWSFSNGRCGCRSFCSSRFRSGSIGRGYRCFRWRFCGWNQCGGWG